MSGASAGGRAGRGRRGRSSGTTDDEAACRAEVVSASGLSADVYSSRRQAEEPDRQHRLRTAAERGGGGGRVSTETYGDKRLASKRAYPM